MKFNPVFTTAIGVLLTSLQMCAAAPAYESNSSYPPGWAWDTAMSMRIAESNPVVRKLHIIMTIPIFTAMFPSFILVLAGLGLISQSLRG
ncbi:hypothetical protein GX50_06010 [[Emmonsia] crescens]|uniref:Uncharacterized protein n=1 Tax=[Emmonsia] crescens TaxID=73230 RepID=A0A2B7ZCB6_9EURO|nr:hypothetical protein GX50_06010 [Emmonsia crescens]